MTAELESRDRPPEKEERPFVVLIVQSYGGARNPTHEDVVRCSG